MVLSKRRPGTVTKNVKLAAETIAAVQAWADGQGTTFSAALDTLVRIGLGEAPATAVAPALVGAVRREVQRQGHRLASLMAACAVDAGTGMRLGNAIIRELDPAKGRAITLAARQATVEALRRNRALRELELTDGDREGELPADA
ncbi:MAG TPA: hypothetical protein VFL91_22075 [Thermomicrobiales bacterium]|nr:hypothetical protein [Thermomicrobiales bacterium]